MARRSSNDHDAAPRRVVYTALIGQYEALNEQPISAMSDVEFICFTDDPEIVSTTWQVRLIEPRFAMDTIRSARYLKIMGPRLLDEFDESLWIDNSVLLLEKPETILAAWLSDAAIAIPQHSYRTSVLGEFDAIATQGYDDPARVYEQLIHYSATKPGVLDEVPHWTALLARRHTSEVFASMDLWFDHINRYSRRDQLSINYVISATALTVETMVIDNHESKWHRWPLLTDRKWSVTQNRLATALRVPQVEVGNLENVVGALRTELDELRNQVHHTIDEFESSASWRLTAPLRSITRRIRR